MSMSKQEYRFIDFQANLNLLCIITGTHFIFTLIYYLNLLLMYF
jgi:hypothetical protein